MNISPILLLALGATFALFYGMIITVGWAITRKNRKLYHNAFGYSEVELFDLNKFHSLEKKIKTVSLENNFFVTGNATKINLKNFDCYVIEVTSFQYPQLHKGDLILVEPSTNKIKYAFKIPDLKEFR